MSSSSINDGKTKGDVDDLAPKVDTKTATLRQVFSQADSTDIMLMSIGTISALATGAAFPFFNILFGNMIDALNTDPNGFADRCI